MADEDHIMVRFISFGAAPRRRRRLCRPGEVGMLAEQHAGLAVDQVAGVVATFARATLIAGSNSSTWKPISRSSGAVAELPAIIALAGPPSDEAHDR